MTIKLYSKFHTPIVLSDTLPRRDDERIIANAKSWIAEDEGNEFLIQELQSDSFTIRLNSFCIKQPTSFIITAPFTICIQISLFQTIHYELAGYGTVILHQRHYNIIGVPSFSAQFKISNHSLLLPFEICFSQDFLLPLRQTYHHLDEFIKRVEKGKPAALFEVSPIASTEMLAMIDLIIECGRDKSWDPDWLNVYVAELLQYALKPKHKTKKVKFTQDEINCLYNSEELLLQNEKKSRANRVKTVSTPNSGKRKVDETDTSIDEMDWNIKELAECADMSVYTFTKIFKEVFGQSVMNYRKEIIWQIVLILLLRGQENLKTITSIAGYLDQPSFSRAFKKRFESTPSIFVQLFLKKFKNYKKNAKRNME